MNYVLNLTGEQVDDITVEGLGNYYTNTVDLSFPYPEDEDIETLINLENVLKYFIPSSEYDVTVKLLKGSRVDEIDKAIESYRESNNDV